MKVSDQIKYPEIDCYGDNLITEKKPIASGGFGNVFKGNYLSQLVAKKEMHKFDLKEFMKELSTTHCFRNIHTPTVLGMCEEFHVTLSKKNVYVASILLEFISGKTLKSLTKGINKDTIKLPQNELIFLLYMIDLAKAIEFLHQMNLVHRDIKPDNILISKDFDLKLIDFGISKTVERTSVNTTSGKGTISYAPPENTVTDMEEDIEDWDKTDFSEQRKVYKSFDIWSFGLILNEVFGCEPPWADKKGDANKIILELMNKTKFPVSKSIENREIIDLIKECTIIDPKKRINIANVINTLISIFKDRIRQHSSYIDITNLYNDNRLSKIFYLIYRLIIRK